MKHQLTWYILPDCPLHRTSRKNCFGWSFQPDTLEFQELFEACPDVKEWCPLCLMYGRGLIFEANSLVLTKYTISHVQSSPVLESPWNVRFLCMGTPDSAFLRKFCISNSNPIFREVLQFDVSMAEEQLYELGTPKTDIDRLALEEALQAIRFLKEWTSAHHTIISKEESYP